jgi:hypothetical protein
MLREHGGAEAPPLSLAKSLQNEQALNGVAFSTSSLAIALALR